MKTPVDPTVRIAPPDKAAEILRGMGYPVGAKFLRRLYKSGQLPGTFTGKRVLIPIAKAVELLENGTLTEQAEQSGTIRQINT